MFHFRHTASNQLSKPLVPFFSAVNFYTRMSAIQVDKQTTHTSKNINRLERQCKMNHTVRETRGTRAINVHLG